MSMVCHGHVIFTYLYRGSSLLCIATYCHGGVLVVVRFKATTAISSDHEMRGLIGPDLCNCILNPEEEEASGPTLEIAR